MRLGMTKYLFLSSSNQPSNLLNVDQNQEGPRRNRCFFEFHSIFSKTTVGCRARCIKTTPTSSTGRFSLGKAPWGRGSNEIGGGLGVDGCRAGGWAGGGILRTI